jgi:ribosome assembly protein YihI (activator of Der GTPase)
MTHIIDEIRATELELLEAETRYDELWDMTDIGHTLTMESLRKVEDEMRRLRGLMNVLSAHLGMLEADFQAEEDKANQADMMAHFEE